MDLTTINLKEDIEQLILDVQSGVIASGRWVGTTTINGNLYELQLKLTRDEDEFMCEI